MRDSIATRCTASTLLVAGLLLAGACSTRGSTWIREPVNDYEFEGAVDVEVPPAEPRRLPPRSSRTLGELESRPSQAPEAVARRIELAKVEGRPLGTFRNTYYDFPSERDFTGKPTPLFTPECRVIDQVPKDFHDSVCVQGSGVLKSGVTVSFAKRDCACAATCPRTEQKICFHALDAREFPWGRGATGRAITPLLTVAVDPKVIPLGTAIYIPQYDGLPRDPARTSFHDGCFVAQDRGLRVRDQHVDIFTGDPRLTKLWNRMVPSNSGVSVILESPRCARAAVRR